MNQVLCQQALELIDRARRIVVVTHVSPDGDAIGSLLGMGRILRQLGKMNVTLACDDAVPAKFFFLPGAVDVENEVSTSASFDLILSLDCSDERRCGQVFYDASNGRTPVINIDHHVTNTGFGQVNIVLPDTVATTEALHRLMKEWNLDLDADTALCLMTGLVTDTLCFRTANVTSEVMQVAAELMQAGADLALVTSQTVNRKSFDAVRYWGALLQTAQLEERVVWVYASAASRRAAGYWMGGDASVATFLITSWEADMAASFVETEVGQIDMSFRAKPDFDVAGIAFELGGGGHPTASGCTIYGPLEQTMKRVLAMMKKARREQVNQLQGR